MFQINFYQLSITSFLHNKKALFQALYKGLYKIICITFHKITIRRKNINKN
nr:MAG TPA: hypothetical protein [Caudoviricetes sp.]